MSTDRAARRSKAKPPHHRAKADPPRVESDAEKNISRQEGVDSGAVETVDNNRRGRGPIQLDGGIIASIDWVPMTADQERDFLAAIQGVLDQLAVEALKSGESK